jgi:hypothetical protein
MGSMFGGILTLITVGLNGPTINKWEKENQGIWLSLKNSTILIAVYTFVLLVAISIYLKISYASSIYWIIWLFIGFGLSIFFSFTWGGGRAFIQHFMLRFFLYLNGYIPLNFVGFLNYATENLFMQKVGGGYIFIHRMLMEHFANMKLDKISR